MILWSLAIKRLIVSVVPCYSSEVHLLGLQGKQPVLHHIYNPKDCRLALLEKSSLFSCANESQIWCLGLDYWGCQDNCPNICENINCKVFPGWLGNGPWVSSVSFFRWRKFCISAFAKFCLYCVVALCLDLRTEVVVGTIMIKIMFCLSFLMLGNCFQTSLFNHFLWRSQELFSDRFIFGWRQYFFRSIFDEINDGKEL